MKLNHSIGSNAAQHKQYHLNQNENTYNGQNRTQHGCNTCSKFLVYLFPPNAGHDKIKFAQNEDVDIRCNDMNLISTA